MKVDRRKPEDCPRCPYCKATTPSFTDIRTNTAPAKGDVSVCLQCSGVALFVGEGVLTRRPDFEEKHDLFTRPDVISAISVANHIRNHHMDD